MIIKPEKLTYEEMKAQYRAWLVYPLGKQSEFFKRYGWTRNDFFDEASRKGDDV